MKIVIKNFIHRYITTSVSRFYDKQYRNLLKENNITNKHIEGEGEWIKKWSILGKANPIYFRLFSHYIGNNLNIIPEDICRNVIEPILDPLSYVPYYSDKNMFDKLFGYSAMPRTIFRKMHGFYYDKDYQRIDIYKDSILNNILNTADCPKIVIKPTVDSSSGNGVRLFEKKNNKWFELGSKHELNIKYLEKFYGNNIIVQECVEQIDYISYFNPTSVNTLRLTLYRSVKTDECHITSAVIRIGKNGSYVDNAHAGGALVGINNDGTLCNKVLDQYGKTTTEFNGIDFTKEHKIPNWDQVVEFAKEIGQNIPHLRLLAMDIMIDKSGTPKLIEFNCDGYGLWAFQFTVGPALGKYTDEIIKYCKENIDKANIIIKI